MTKYEVYVPDGQGDMSLQLLTLDELKTLLARQSTIQRRYQSDTFLNPVTNDKVTINHHQMITSSHNNRRYLLHIGSTKLDRISNPFFLEKALTCILRTSSVWIHKKKHDKSYNLCHKKQLRFEFAEHLVMKDTDSINLLWLGKAGG